MQTSVTFKNLEPSDHLKTYVSEKLDRFDKLLDNPAEADVVLMVEKHRHIAEISLNGDRLTVNGKEETGDMYSAIDMVLDKLEKQIKRSKQKIRDRRAGAKGQTRTIREEPAAAAEEDDGREIAVQSVDYKPMDVEEAVLQMDLTTENFLVFTNARSEQINVLYRRKDGRYGLIQPRS
jgi:putative sigma-54 modulation protein